MERQQSFWAEHLAAVDNPMIHWLPEQLKDREAIAIATGDLGFATFVIDAASIRSTVDLFDALAEAMNFPSYFGRNWMAVVDLLTDLSWAGQHLGYVLLLTNAERLPFLPGSAWSHLLCALEDAVHQWRDERGEYGDRSGPIPFHVIFSGGDDMRGELERKLHEPLCIHEGGGSVRRLLAPGGVSCSGTFGDAQKLIQAGAGLETILALLRDREYGEIDAVYTIAALVQKSVPEAKQLVDSSATWSPILKEQAERVRRAARDALRDFGWDDDSA